MTSREVQPPGSGVPVPGHCKGGCYQAGGWARGWGLRTRPGSSTSMSRLRYVGVSVPILSMIALMIPLVPISSISSAEILKKPWRSSSS